MPTDQRLSGKLMLREALGSEIIAHFEIEAPPVLTEDTRQPPPGANLGPLAKIRRRAPVVHHFEAHLRNAY